MNYDIAINNYFNGTILKPLSHKQPMRYGENPHQKASFYGDLTNVFDQLNGKELSYNNLVDVDAAVQLIHEFNNTTFAIIKHTNVCGVASRATSKKTVGIQPLPATTKALLAAYWFVMAQLTKQQPKPSTKFSLKC